VRSEKGGNLKLILKLKKGHFLKIIKLMLPLWRNQMRIKGRE
jgi:hypothetical protein